jgi:hypothetical protein
VCEIQSIKIEKATEKGRGWQGQTSDEKGHKDDSFVGVLCRNGNPVPDSPGTQLLWRKNTNFDEVQEVRLGDNRDVVAGKWKLAVRIDWQDNWNINTMYLPLGSHHDLSSEAGGLKSSGNREATKEKARIRVPNSRGYLSINMGWLDKSDSHSKRALKFSVFFVVTHVTLNGMTLHSYLFHHLGESIRTQRGRKLQEGSQVLRFWAINAKGEKVLSPKQKDHTTILKF